MGRLASPYQEDFGARGNEQLAGGAGHGSGKWLYLWRLIPDPKHGATLWCKAGKP